MPQFPFNPQQYQNQAPMERLPRGWYPAIIEESEIVETNNKDGFRLKLKFRIIDGPGKGRTIPKGYNIQNPNPQTVEIAMREIKTVCTCVGIFAPINQTEEMHNKPLQIMLTEPKDSDYNDVKGYKDIQGNDPDKIGAGAPVAHVQQPPQGYAQPAPGPAPVPPAWQPTAPAPPAAPAPAWAPPQAAAPVSYAPVQPAPAYAPAPPVAPSVTAPAWAPGPPQAAPAWAPQR